MKKLIYILLFTLVLISSFNAFGQCTPHSYYIELNPAGGTQSINNTGCGIYTFNNVPPWVTMSSPTEGSIVATAVGSNTSVARYAEITCTIPSQGISYNIMVFQDTVFPTSCTLGFSEFLPPNVYFPRWSYEGETRYITPILNGNCPNDLPIYSNVPSWLNVSYQYGKTTQIQITCQPNSTTDIRAATIIFRTPIDNINYAYEPVTIVQNPCQIAWYPDSDGDGFGDYYADATLSCGSPFTGAVTNNYDNCPNINTSLNNGCPSGYIVSDFNWISGKTYDITGTLKSNSKSYFDALGKPVQSQTLDLETNLIWASQTVYDSQGRPALNTLNAPVDRNGKLIYLPDFVQTYGFVAEDHVIYDASHFESNPEDPKIVVDKENTLGWYYSQNNTNEPYQDITDRPYSRTIYSELNPGSPLKVVGGNKTDTNQDGIVDDTDDWLQSYAFTMKAGEELAQASAFNDPSYSTANRKIFKTVSRDVHGVENVAFVDNDGKTLATARSGSLSTRNSNLTIGTQGFVDIHVPQNTTGFTVNKPANINIEVFDLITEQPLTAATTSLENGFYRVAVTNLEDFTEGDVTIDYSENYYDYSLNYYDDIGRLLSSTQPLAQLETTYEYDTLGQLIRTISPDEGTAEFVYRNDGQIRFSQNSKQALAGEYSYTNYDHLARPIESGVVTDSFSITMNGDVANNFTGTRSEQYFTTYDYLDTTSLSFLSTINGNYNAPTFLAGNVAKTNNDNTTTYYNYDVYGRVKWLVQNINGLGVKTIDYEYDPITGQVNKVYYQKNDTNERFVHRYTYDSDDYSLTKVETSTDDINFITHAEYNYYETGGLKNVILADGLQQTDYVYNLAGQLKAINHPTLNASNDPGGNTNDMFGMMIDYHNNDYKRPLSNINSPNYGTNQYNGNIKGIRWNTEQASNAQATYSYNYNRNNWLTGATFGNYTEGTGVSIDIDITSTTIVAPNENLVLQASNSITLLPGFHAQEGSNSLAEITTASQGGFTPSDDYTVSNITYDANGNIQSLKRNKNTENSSNAMDDLNYEYKTDKPNQLLRVEDAVGDVGVGDIDTQIGDADGENYKYNSIGQLMKNIDEDLAYSYNTNGLVTEVTKLDGIPIVKFFYDDKGKRVKKESYVNNNLSTTTYYVRDVAGSPMGIYIQQAGGVMALKEQPVYGSSRVGVFNRTDNSTAYQLTDHLGNVRAVMLKQQNGNTLALIAKTDYYPGGMLMPNRNVDGGYRYGYQGEYAEADDETGMPAFELRLYDPRINRWMSPDPMDQYYSPYMAMDNRWNMSTDPTGGCTDCSQCPDACEQLNISRIHGGNSIDINWETGGFYLKGDIESSYYGGGSDLGNVKNTRMAKFRRWLRTTEIRGGGAGAGGFSLFSVSEPKMPENLPVAISVGYEFASPIKIPFSDYYGYGFDMGLTSIDDPNDANKIGGIRGFTTDKRAIDPGIALGINITFSLRENHLNTPVTADRLRGFGTEVGASILFGGSASTDQLYFYQDDGTILQQKGTYLINSLVIGAGIDGYSEWVTKTKVSGE